MEKKKLEPEQERGFRILFLLYFPTLLIICIGIMIKNQVLFTALAGLVAFYQFIVLKRYIDTSEKF